MDSTRRIERRPEIVDRFHQNRNGSGKIVKAVILAAGKGHGSKTSRKYSKPLLQVRGEPILGIGSSFVPPPKSKTFLSIPIT